MKPNQYIISCVNRTIKVFNASTGFLYKSVVLPGDIINGPIQDGDKFTVIINFNNAKQGRIYKLPNCFLVRSFNAQ